MPQVFLKYNIEKVSKETVITLVKVLPKLVAGCLTTAPENPEGSLSADDIEVDTKSFGEFDIHTKDIEIIVWANSYPERLKNKEERCSYLDRFIKEYLPAETTNWTWILLAEGAFCG